MTSLSWRGGGGVTGCALLVALAVGCAPSRAVPVGTPAPDPQALAGQIVASTTPAAPRRIDFAWRLDEAGSRVSGRGVVRYEAPTRLRLDLFGPRGETYLAAALVGEEYRFPGGAVPAVALPSPTLLWAALGVVRPPGGAALVSAATTAEEAMLRYVGGDDTFEYRVVTAGPPALLGMERIGPTGVLESVRLERGADRQLSRTKYRDWSAFRDLQLETESFEDATSFPESIWRPGSGR